MKISKRKIKWMLIVYGLIMAGAVFFAVGRDSTEISQMPLRVTAMQEALDSVVHGRIPDPFKNGDAQPGFYMFVPYIMYHGFGITDAETVLELCQIFYGALFIGSIPLLTYLLSESVFAGVISPLAAHLIMGELLYGRKTSPYYAMAWGTVLSFFLLSIMLKREWKKWSWTLAAAECMVIAMGNFVRVGSMIFCEAAFIAVLIYKEYTSHKPMRGGYGRICKSILSRRVLITAACMLLLSAALENGAAKLIGRAEGMQMSPRPTQWHSLYIGLGFEENPYGLYYQDECAIKKAESIDPDVVYQSEEYYEILQNEYMRMLRKEPWFVMKGYIKKTVLCIVQSFFFALAYTNRIYVLPGGAAVCFYIIKKRPGLRRIATKFRGYILLWGSLYLGGLVQGIMAAPRSSYIYGSIGMILAFIFFLIVGISTEIFKMLCKKQRGNGD